MATSGTLAAGTAMSGNSMTISLPAGVTPALDTTGHPDTSKLVAASGVTTTGGLVSTAIYQAATATQPAQITVAVAGKDKLGFGTGEFMTLTLNLTPFVSPTTTDFPISDFVAADLDGKAISGLQANVTAVTIQ